MQEPTFDIFSGKIGENPVWMEAVEGLSHARARMNDLAAQIPGRYFVYSLSKRVIVAEIETFAKDQSASNDTSTTA